MTAVSNPSVFLITGPPGSGKTCTCRALLHQFERGVHIEVDRFREAVVSGYASPVDPWTDETTRQFELARRAAVHTARLYADADFAVAIDDVVFPDVLGSVYQAAFPNVLAVTLLPGKEECLQRNSARSNKDFDPVVLANTISVLCDEMTRQTDGFAVIDNSSLTVEETASAILELAKRP